TLTFSATAGQRVQLQFSGSTYASTCCNPTERLYKPDGTQLWATSGSTAFMDTTTLPVDGTYQILIDPSGTTTGSIAATLTSVPADTTGTIAIDGAVATVTTVAGQNANLTFTATAGQRVQLQFSSSTYASTCCNPTERLYQPDGTQLWATSGSTAFMDTTTLPVDGTYRIFVDPSGTTTGSISATLWSVPADSTSGITIDGPAATVTTVAGQNANLTFTATAGQRVQLQFSGSTYASTCCNPTERLYQPNGTQLWATSGSTALMDTTTLPVDGTYRILVDPSGTTTGSIAATLTSVPADVSATAAIDSGPHTVTTVAGQNANLTFAATAGQQVQLQFSGSTYSSTCCNPTERLYKPDGTQLWATSGSTALMDTTVLPADGTYRILVDPSGTTTGSITVTVPSVPADATGTLTIDGPAHTVSTVAGQNAALTFAGTASQKVTVSFSGATYPCCTSVAVRKPDGTNLSSTSISSSGSLANLVLPVTGSYTVYVNPSGTAAGMVTVGVQSVPTGAPALPAWNGPLAASGTTAPASSSSAAGSGPVRHVPSAWPAAPARTGAHRAPARSVRLSAGARQQDVPERPASPASTATPASRAGTGAATTAADPAEAWTPDRFNLAGYDWDAHRAPVTVNDPPLRAPSGATAVSGQVLTLAGKPLPGVTMSADGSSSVTDHLGRFLVTGLSAGHHELLIDGRTASTPGRAWGVFEVGVDLEAHQTYELPYTVWMTRLDTRDAVSFPSPTTSETVLTTPRIPGFEVRLPKGTVVKGLDDKVVTKLSITAIPVDRPPFPLPAGVVTPVYFTVQPGGSYVFPDGAQIVYPNLTHLAPGQRVDFWDYDPEDKGWFVYGHGAVTKDGKQVVPDPGVRVWEFSGAMINAGQSGAGKGPNGDPQGKDGDPVDLGTGLLQMSKSDLALPDVMPIGITRTYRQTDSAARTFGIGTNWNYGIFLQSANQYQEADLVMPDSAKIHYVRTSPGTGWSDAVFESTGTPGPWYKSTIVWNGLGWDLTTVDGTVYVFGENQPLQAIRDRYGNQVTLTRSSGQGGNITQVTSPNGRWIKLTYDSSNRITQATDNIGRTAKYLYDASGRLSQVTDVKGGITTYAYDATNELLTAKDARGITFLTNTYDASGRVATQQLGDGGTYRFAYVTDASGAITETDVTDPDGHVRKATFDSSGFETSETFAAGLPEQRRMTYQRDPSTHFLTSVTDGLGRTTSYAYNSSGNVTSMTRLAGTASARTTQYAYGGPYGQMTSVTDPLGHATTYRYDSNGDVTSVTDPEGRQTAFGYAGNGQRTSTTNPAGKTSTTSYLHGDPVAVTDPLGRTQTMTTDAVGRVIAATDPLGAKSYRHYDTSNALLDITDPLGNVTSSTYDANGNLLTVKDPKGNVTTYTYDNADRVASVKDPLLATTSYKYDGKGNLTQVTDRRGKVTTYNYDGLDEPTFVGYGTVTGPSYESTVTSTYDAVGRLVKIVDSANGTTQQTFDAADMLTNVSGPQGSVSYGYDAVGRRTTMTAGTEAPVSYGYDRSGALTSITQGSTSASFQYDSGGRRSQVSMPGLTESYTYDAGSQLTGIAYASGSTSLGNLAYQYDPDGRIVSAGGSLASVTVPATMAAPTYNADNELSKLGTTKYTYDAAGNLTSDGSRTYAWNARNQLTGVSATGLTSSFTYDPLGRRSGKTVNGTTTKFLYDGVNIAEEQSSTGSVTASYLNGLRVDEPLVRTAGGSSSSYATGSTGSTVGLVSGGSLATKYAYSPFGAATASGAASTNSLQFAGRENDGATGLLYLRNRYYNPATQQFISQDPVGFSGGSASLYAYALDDPTDLSDPMGTDPIGGCIVGGLAGVGIGWLTHALTGRKYTLGDGLRDAATGCVIGAITSTIGPEGLYFTKGLQIGEDSVEELSGTALARQLGQEGEAAVSEAGSTARIPSLSDTASYRIPDIFNPEAGYMGEVKNVGSLSYTNQLRDMVAYAQQEGLDFYLYVRPSTQLSGPLQDAIAAGDIIPRYLP
ncbi:MAG: RHS repeat-associated core domain-containing protein, partial [Frankiaceae bacterium]